MSDIMLYGVLRMPYELAMSDEISRLQFYQRAQEAADRLEKCETTNTTPSQAASIDTPEFHELLWGYNYSVSDFGASYSKDDRAALIAHIDAKLAQAEARAIAAESRAEKAEQYAQVALGIKDSLEARLAEIQRGVEGLQRYHEWHSTFGTCVATSEDGDYVLHEEVVALLQPQGQADTSGLPG